MSTPLPGNPYADRMPATPAAAVSNALMALTYEQRTANLIAMMRETYDRAALHEKIADRLGWPEGGLIP